jgi:hypothetical protein
LLVLLCAMTLALACANLSGVLLARWSAREGDLAVQAALGASHGRLVSQVVGESLALSMLAVVLSAPVALWSAKSLTLLLWNQSDGPSPLDLSLDYRIFGVMVGLAVVVALCVSLLPASRVWSARRTLARGTRGLPGLSPGATVFTATGRLSCRCRQTTVKRWACRSWPDAISDGATRAVNRKSPS